MELKGHTDNIRALQLNAEGTMCLSGSSDHSLRLWDLRQRNCLKQWRHHEDSVWAIACDTDWNTVLTAGRDGSVFQCSVMSEAQEVAPVLKGVGPIAALALASGSSQLWLAANSKTPVVARWSLEEAKESACVGNTCAPDTSLTIGAGIVRCRTLNDRQHVVAQDSQGEVSQWNVSTASMVQVPSLTPGGPSTAAVLALALICIWLLSSVLVCSMLMVLIGADVREGRL